MLPVAPSNYSGLLESVSELLKNSRRATIRAIDSIMTVTYWEVGRRIVEFEQGGQKRAAYGENLLKRLSHDLVGRFGKGFGLSNLKLMKKFYITYKNRRKGQTLSGLFVLPWSNYVRLLSLSDSKKRDFYEEQARISVWSVRQLDRQINSLFYERTMRSAKKSSEKAKMAVISEKPDDQIRDPYIFEFLGLPEPFCEKELEEALISHLADFLVELGYGFTFVARQKRLQIGNESYYLDLLLYHRRLKCLVAIDLKIGKFNHSDAGQMNLYLNYLKENEVLEGEMPPIGLILCTEKDESVVHYALGGLSHKVFASRYKLELPDPKVLKKEIEMEKYRLSLPSGPGNKSL